MDATEALAWLRGERSSWHTHANTEEGDMRRVACAQEDAAMMQQALCMLQAEGLLDRIPPAPPIAWPDASRSWVSHPVGDGSGPLPEITATPCPRCEANAELHRRCPEHQPEETSCGPGICSSCGKETWDYGHDICSDPECDLHEPEKNTAGKDHPRCPKHGEPQPCNVCRAEDAEAEVLRIHAIVQDILAAREQARVMDDRPWVALEHLEQAIDKAEGPGAAGPAEIGARAAEAPSPQPVDWRYVVGELLVAVKPVENARQIENLLDGHVDADAAREKRHRKVRHAAKAVLEILEWASGSWRATGNVITAGKAERVTEAFRAALKEDSDG